MSRIVCAFCGKPKGVADIHSFDHDWDPMPPGTYPVVGAHDPDDTDCLCERCWFDAMDLPDPISGNLLTEDPPDAMSAIERNSRRLDAARRP